MHGVRVLVIVAVVVTVATVLSAPPSRADIADGGFESGSLVTPAASFPLPMSFGEWTRPNTLTMLVSPPEPVHSGTFAVRVNTTGSSRESYVVQDFDSGTLSYELAFWVYPQAGSSVAELIYNWDRSFGKAEGGSQFVFAPDSTAFSGWNATVALTPVPYGGWHEVRVVANRCTGVQKAFLDGAPWGSFIGNMTPPSGLATIILGDAFGGLHGLFGYDDVSFTLFDCTATPPTACPRTQGYWKTHPDAWPVDAMLLGNQTYSKAELLTILDTPPQGDASLVLAHQLIAAKLNVANGADPAPVKAVIAEADALLKSPDKLPYDVRPSSPRGQEMVALAGILDAYNNGKMTPGCHGAGPRK